MNRKEWEPREGHPAADLLLLHLEEELTGSTAEAVTEHLNGCAPCRLACRQLELGFSRFSTFHRDASVPVLAPRANEFRARLLKSAPPSPSLIERLRELVRISTPRRLGIAMGGLTLGLVLWASIFLTAPRQSVYASQLLDDARGASQSLFAHSKVLNQKIRLRRGALIIERAIHRGRPAPLDADAPKIDSNLQQELDLARVNLDDPLNAEDFALWRAAQKDPRDSVRETQESVIITTRVAGSAIAEGTLTLSRVGLRPIARTVEVRGHEPIEISELSYEITDSPSLTPVPAIGGLGLSAAEAVNATPASATVSTTDLETSEVDLREAFHSIGADSTAAPEIWTGNQAVFYHISALRPTQAAAIRALAGRIPHIIESEKEPPQLAERGEQINGSGPYTTTPPLADALQTKLGSAQAAASFVDAMRAHASHVLAEADALDELAHRYPAETLKTLPPSLRIRVNRLAASLLSKLQHDSADYLKSLSPTLDAMAQDLQVTGPANESDESAGCMPWQQSADLAAPKLRNLASDTSLLFVPRRSETQPPVNAEQLMTDTLKARSFVKFNLMSTCQLFSTN